MAPLQSDRNRELGDAVLEIRSRGEAKCLSHEQKLLFLSHHESRTSRNTIISHATRWQLGWRRRDRNLAAQQNALYARSLVGWDYSSSAIGKKATEAKLSPGLRNSPIAGQENDKAQASTYLEQENIRRTIMKFQFRWRISKTTPLLGRIDPPDQIRQIDIMLQQALTGRKVVFPLHGILRSKTILISSILTDGLNY